LALEPLRVSLGYRTPITKNLAGCNDGRGYRVILRSGGVLFLLFIVVKANNNRRDQCAFHLWSFEVERSEPLLEV
jgi:hypothetical protein